MRKEFVIDGKNFEDIEGFYSEIDRVFTNNRHRKTEYSLNSLNTVLRGGARGHGEPITLRWVNYSKSRRDFGYEATVRHYEQLLSSCRDDKKEVLSCMLLEAKQNTGITLMDIIVEIILDKDESGYSCNFIREQ